MFSRLYRKSLRIHCTNAKYSCGEITSKNDFKEENKIITKAIFKFYSDSKLIDKSVWDGRKLSNEVSTPAKKELVRLFAKEDLEYVAQLYAYYKMLVPRDVQQEREKKIIDTCHQYFENSNLAAPIGSFIDDKIGFTLQTSSIEHNVRLFCSEIIWAGTVYRIEKQGDIIPFRPGIFRVAQEDVLAEVKTRNDIFIAAAQDAGQSFMADYSTTDEVSKILNVYLAHVAAYVSILPLNEASKVLTDNLQVVKTPKSFNDFEKLANFIKVRFAPNDMAAVGKNQRCAIKMLEKFRETGGSMNFKKSANEIEANYDQRHNEYVTSQFFPSAVEGAFSGNFHGKDAMETTKCLSLLIAAQHTLAKAIEKNAHDYLKDNQKSAKDILKAIQVERLAREIKKFSDDDTKSDQKQDNDDETKEEKKDQSVATDPLLTVSAEAGALLEQFLRDGDEPEELAPLNDEQEDKQEDKQDLKEDEEDEGPDRPSIKDLRQKPKIKPASEKPRKRKKRKKHKRSKTISTEVSEPQEKLLSIAVKEGIDFRLNEMTLLRNQLAKAVDEHNDSSQELKDILDEAQDYILTLTTERFATSWEPDQLHSMLWKCDDCANRLRARIRKFVRRRTNLDSFAKKLDEAIEKEPLIAGKGWGGVVDKVLAGQFYMIEAAYHGRRFDPKKKVVINGTKRHLEYNEALTYYVTKSSTSDGIKYCISIRLWNLRDKDEEREVWAGRLYSPGKNVDPKDILDPKIWRYSGYTMAVLHIK